jgi:hypothetical protein
MARTVPKVRTAHSVQSCLSVLAVQMVQTVLMVPKALLFR